MQPDIANVSQCAASEAENQRGTGGTSINTQYNEAIRSGLFDIYGKEPPIQCMLRLEEELLSFPGKEFMDDVLLLDAVNKTLKRAGYEVNACYNTGASLIYWLSGITAVNPLPPHYHCPKCKKTIFFIDGDGWDLPVLNCCGKPMIREGHSIPFESLKIRMPAQKGQLDLVVPVNLTEEVLAIVRRHYDKKARLVEIENQNEEFAGYLKGDPYVLIPLEAEFPETDENGVWQVDLKEIFDLKYRIIQLYCLEDKELFHGSHMKTNLYDLLTEPVFQAVKKRLEEQITEQEAPDTEIDKKPLLDCGKQSFSLLVKMTGYYHAFYTSDNPALNTAGANYSDLFTCSEDVLRLVSSFVKPEYGISNEFAVQIAKHTRRGHYTYGRMDEGTERILRELGVPDYWITQMKHTRYLPPRGMLIEELIDEMRLAWNELQ